MFSIFSHKENANQNSTEIPSHPNQNGYHQENKQQMLMRTEGRVEGENGPYALLVGV
jgi:hypothetical protein